MRNQSKWRHLSCIDIDIYIQKISYVGKDYIKLKVNYINRHNDIVYNYQPELVKIYKKDLYLWKEVKNAS